MGQHFKILGYNLLKLVGWGLLAFMGYSLLKSEITGNWNWNYTQMLDFNMKQDKRNATRLRIVYLLHILIIVPLLLYIGKNKKTYPRIEGSMCILAVFALLYHGYSYWRSETTGQWNWLWVN